MIQDNSVRVDVRVLLEFPLLIPFIVRLSLSVSALGTVFVLSLISAVQAGHYLSLASIF